MFEFRDLSHGDMGWIIKRHAEVYNNEFGWHSLGLEILTTEIVLDFAKNHDPKREKVWVALHNDRRVGCVFLVKENESTAKIRLVFVEEELRGMGLGRSLVEQAMKFAKEKEYKDVVLWTHSALHSARKIYESFGFKLVSEEKHSRFGPELTGQWRHVDL